MKQWDTTLESAVKSALTAAGVSDVDVLSSLHEIRKDANGEWVVRRLSVAMKDPALLNSMVKQLESAGAHVQKVSDKKSTILLWKHSSRVYH